MRKPRGRCLDLVRVGGLSPVKESRVNKAWGAGGAPAPRRWGIWAFIAGHVDGFYVPDQLRWRREGFRRFTLRPDDEMWTHFEDVPVVLGRTDHDGEIAWTKDHG